VLGQRHGRGAPLATAPVPTLDAVTARLALLAPAWLGWRRAMSFYDD
jgi:hypothetical protein